MLKVKKDTDEKTLYMNTNANLNDIHINKPKEMKDNKTTSFEKKQEPVAQFQPPQLKPQPPVFDNDSDTESEDDFDLLANPEKKLPETNEDTGGGMFEKFFNTKQEVSDSGSSLVSSPRKSSNPPSDMESYHPVPFQDQEETNLSYSEIQKGKAKYLSLFDKLEKKGVKLHKKYNMSHEYSELKNEYIRLKTQLDMEMSVATARKMLLGCVTGMEWLNNRYDPFRLKLNGWSEQVFTEIEENQYDDTFEELYFKYGGGPEMEPELKLVFLLGSSASWFHLSKTMFANPNNVDNVMQTMKQDPMFMQKIVNEAKTQLRQEGFAQQQQQAPRQAPPPQQDGFGRDFMPTVVNNGNGRQLDPRPQPSSQIPTQPRPVPKQVRPEMKGPSTHVEDVLRRLQEKNGESDSDSSSSESSVESESKSVNVPPPKKPTRGRGRGRGRGATRGK